MKKHTFVFVVGLLFLSFLALPVQSQQTKTTATQGWTTVFFEDFEDIWKFYPRWMTHAYREYTWGLVAHKSYSGNKSLWCVGHSSEVKPSLPPYPNNLNCVVSTTDPFDLRNCTKARLRFKIIYKVEELGNDYFVVKASDGSPNMWEHTRIKGNSSHQVNGVWTEWESISYNLAKWPGFGSFLGHAHFRIALVFKSDDFLYTTARSCEGVYIDSLVIEKWTETGIETETENPETFYLEQNYPNPFNLLTTIRFHLPKPSYVNMNIYDMRGRRIVNLIEQDLDAGYYENEWDGRDMNGEPAPSGVYMIKLTANENTLTRKLLLLK